MVRAKKVVEVKAEKGVDAVMKSVKKSDKKADGKKRKTKHTTVRAHGIYIHRVLKQVHPDLRISNTAMSIIGSLVDDMFERFAHEASVLAKYAHRQTIASREVQSAARLVLPGELSKHAVSEGQKAMLPLYPFEESPKCVAVEVPLSKLHPVKLPVSLPTLSTQDRRSEDSPPPRRVEDPLYAIQERRPSIPPQERHLEEVSAQNFEEAQLPCPEEERLGEEEPLRAQRTPR
ncbi:hypothetical protein QR680_010676 [Steinernema hermaphroditum]|uniref:Core Histone H2A/H2B/H3 domain-containing protein n=1 Tax=Steinernema hermaphroditum TaxID=289476 RepID=A0AA39MC32_9BILA|nr:hypothetical protein QR680_010676 [Steinernema hermaphroditum]